MGLRGYHPHRREKAVADIEAMIRGQGLWGRRLPPERKMAAALNISRGTLHKALELLQSKGILVRRHGSGTFAAERDAAEQGAGRGELRLAIIARADQLPGEGWTYYGDMVKGALRSCRRHGVEATIVREDAVWDSGTSGPGPDWHKLRAFTGFVVATENNPPMAHMLLKCRQGPVVLLDASFRQLPVIGVANGSLEGARRAVSYLVNLGHRRIAYVPPGEHPQRPHEKTFGYRVALSEAGIPVDATLVCHASQGDLDREIEAGVQRLLALEDPPTALFAGTDSRALPAMRALEAAGRRVGEDFAVIGFGDSAARLGLCDYLSSVRIHTRKMGSEAVQAILEAPEVAQGRTIIVPDRLIIRQTSCPPEQASSRIARSGRRARGGRRKMRGNVT